MLHEEYRLVDDVLLGRMSRRQLIKRLMAAGLSLSGIIGLLQATGIGREEAAALVEAASLRVRRGGTLRFAVLAPAGNVDPVTTAYQGGIFTAQMAGEYLCFPRPDYTLEPRLATSWHAAGPDTWTFDLRRGVRWHDGSPFTADDVVATFDRLTDPRVGSNALAFFMNILSGGHTRKVNAYRVTFHLDRPYVNFPYLVSAFNYDTVILPKNYKIGSFVHGRIGTGPFVLTKYTSQRSATFVRNPHYWRHGLPYLDGAEMNFYQGNPAIVLAMEAGTVDIYPSMPYLGSQALFANPSLRILINPSSAYRELSMRVGWKPFTDRRVRQAIALSLNRPSLVKGPLHGLGQIGNDHPFAPVFPDSAAATAGIPLRRNDYAAARKLLAQAGYPRGLSLTLTTESFLEIPQYARMVQQQLKPAGIDVRLNIEDPAEYYGAGTNQPWLEVPLGIVDWAPRAYPSQSIALAYLCGAVWNVPHWCNAQFDGLMTAYDRELDPARRRQLAAEAAGVFHREVPAIIAYWLDELRAVRTNVHGLAGGPASTALDPSTVWRSS